MDILESKESYLVRAELPGMKREDLKLEVHDGVLTLSGERKFEQPADGVEGDQASVVQQQPADGVEYQRTERVAGKFSRSFYLPQTVRQDGINATYRDGILEIHIAKAEEAKPKQIAISVK